MTVSPRILVRKTRRDGSTWRVHKQETFIDPYPWIPGTLPEKMVYAELSKRNVPFIFQADWWEEVTSKLDPEDRFALVQIHEMAPDFLLPAFKTVIEVQGEYWHTDEATKAHDAAKFYVYRRNGFTALAMWEADIIANVAQQVDLIPGIASGIHGKGRVGSHEGLGAGTVAAANALRAKPKAPTYRRRRARGRRRG